MESQRRIEILTTQIEKINSSDWNFRVWFSETSNILELIFDKHETKVKQLKHVFNRPGYNFTGIIAERASVEARELLEAFIREINIQNEIGFSTKSNNSSYVSNQRINELLILNSSRFDFSKLIALCKEINTNYNNKNYYSVAILIRAIMDHVPPVFGKTTFNEVANNIGSKSLKNNFIHLQGSMRNIADSFLHQGIRKNEVQPSENQIDFKADLDTLLSEIIRINK